MWIIYLSLTQNITTLPGLWPLSPHVALGEKGSVYQMTTGEAALISACSVLALNLAPEFRDEGLLYLYYRYTVAIRIP